MMRLCRVANVGEAGIIAGLLATRGIETRILNRFAASASGELPPIETGPEVWIVNEQDEILARRLLREREHPGPARRCPRCGESNPGAFEFCWNCATIFD